MKYTCKHSAIFTQESCTHPEFTVAVVGLLLHIMADFYQLLYGFLMQNINVKDILPLMVLGLVSRLGYSKGAYRCLLQSVPDRFHVMDLSHNTRVHD
jgi:hypothetical protein